MNNKIYTYQPEKKMIKQGALLSDEAGNTVYEAKMIKHSIFSGYTFMFINHIKNTEIEHKVGHTITSETSTNGNTDIFSTKSRFKFDGKNVWDYLHEQGIRIKNKLSDRNLGIDYDITLKGEPFAEVKMGGKIIGNRVFFNLITAEENLDLAFIIAFAIARTEQLFLD